MPRDLVRDIVVLNNQPGDDLTSMANPWLGGDDRVTVISASRNLGIGYNRFFAASLARTRAVLSYDDDLLLTEASVREVYEHWKAEPERVHGCFCRGPVVSSYGKKPVGETEIPTPPKMAGFRYYWYDWLATKAVMKKLKAWRKAMGFAGVPPPALGSSGYWSSDGNSSSVHLQHLPQYDPPSKGSEADREATCPILITRAIVFDKQRAHDYFKHVARFEDTISLQRPFGHGEDLLLSLVSIAESGGRMNRVWRKSFYEMGSEDMVGGGVGVSRVNSDHLAFRTAFMRLACHRLGLPCNEWILDGL